MIIKEIINRPISSNKKFRNHKNLIRNSLVDNINNPFNFNYKISKINKIPLNKILGNNFEVLNLDKNNKIKNDNDYEIFNIIESENEEESIKNSNYYKTNTIKLPEIKIPNKKRILNLKIININEKKLPKINVNKLFYSTNLNFGKKSIKKTIKLENRLNLGNINKELEKLDIISSHNLLINKINMKKVKKELRNNKNL